MVLTTWAQRRIGDIMSKCKYHYCNNLAAADCDYDLCGECCGGCQRHETRSGPVDHSESGGCCDVCGYDFDDLEITLEEHQDPDTGYCDHLKQYKQQEANGFTYAYCMCCDKCLGLSTW